METNPILIDRITLESRSGCNFPPTDLQKLLWKK